MLVVVHVGGLDHLAVSGGREVLVGARHTVGRVLSVLGRPVTFVQPEGEEKVLLGVLGGRRMLAV